MYICLIIQGQITYFTIFQIFSETDFEEEMGQDMKRKQYIDNEKESNAEKTAYIDSWCKVLHAQIKCNT